MKIIIDVDCVVADFVGAVLNVIGKTDRSVAIKYDWWDEACTLEEAKLIRQSLDKSTAFWQQLPLMPDAKEGIAFLRSQGHTIKWCTAPHRPKYGWCSDRRLWLEKHFDIRNHKEEVTFTHHKMDVQGSVIIDDLQTHVDSWEEVNRDGIGFLFASELNSKSTRERVVWKDIMNKKMFRYG